MPPPKQLQAALVLFSAAAVSCGTAASAFVVLFPGQTIAPRFGGRGGPTLAGGRPLNAPSAAAAPGAVAASRSAVVPLGASADDAGSADGAADIYEEKKERPEPLAPSKIAEMIEVTFIHACMQLATGFVDVLKLFVVAAKSGYESGLPVPRLLEELDRCPANTAGRDLAPEERELRSTWINVVYMTLQAAGQGTDDADVGDTVDPAARERFGSLVADVVAAKRAEGGQIPTFDEVLRDAPIKYPNLMAGDDDGDPTQMAIASQSLRVAGLTLTVVDEERQCHEGGGVGPAPRPSIPGAF